MLFAGLTGIVVSKLTKWNSLQADKRLGCGGGIFNEVNSGGTKLSKGDLGPGEDARKMRGRLARGAGHDRAKLKEWSKARGLPFHPRLAAALGCSNDPRRAAKLSREYAASVLRTAGFLQQRQAVGFGGMPTRGVRPRLCELGGAPSHRGATLF